MDPKEIKAAMAAKLTEAKSLDTAKDGDKIAALLGQYDELKAQLDMATRIAQGEAFLNEPAGAQGRSPRLAGVGARRGRHARRPEGVARVQDAHPVGRGEGIPLPRPAGRSGEGLRQRLRGVPPQGLEDMGPEDRKTLSVGVDTAGGFLVPEDALHIITRKVATSTIIRPLARVMTTSRDMATWPRINYSTDDQYTSGVRFTWTGETPASATGAPRDRSGVRAASGAGSHGDGLHAHDQQPDRGQRLRRDGHRPAS